MLRKSAWIGLLFFVFLLPSILLAQETMHGKWWHNKTIINELELTDHERKELDARYTESRRKMIKLKSDIERNRFELDLLLDMKEIDREKIMEHYDNLEQARTELSKQRFQMLMDVRETIGAERYQELKAMHRDRDRKDSKRSSGERPSHRDKYKNRY
ncbi:MAG: periplasmic heavy metal sensor [Deltaproteobacteria bacterium]|jgi:Spy/CpxP family protein refolding chaperone|nr:MAG: periplasmic heavy metal sensor [Deltaproteobacteria bacterium]